MFSPTEVYSPYEVRCQQDQRARAMQHCHSDWVTSVEGITFEWECLGWAAIFSGDLRPPRKPVKLCPACDFDPMAPHNGKGVCRDLKPRR